MTMARVCGGDRGRASGHIVSMNIPILILAAGQSTRMRGVDKLMRQINRVPLLRRVAAMACAATTDAVLVALPAAPHPRWAMLDDLDVTCVTVKDAAEGINASLRAGVSALSGECDAVLVLLADLPDLTASDIKKVAQAVELKPDARIWRGTTNDGKPGHPVVFHRSLFAELRALKGDSGAQSVVQDHLAQVELVPLPRQNARFDLDTPQDWDQWQKTQEI